DAPPRNWRGGPARATNPADPVSQGRLRERAPARAPPAEEYQDNGINGGWVTDRATIERARQGDRAAQRALYEDHVDRVYRVAFRMAGDEDLARDFTQEAFIRAFQRLAEFRGESAFSTWLHAIVVSVSLNGLRKVKRLRTRETVLEDAEALGVSARQVDPDLRDRLYRAIDALPEGYRTVFVLHDVEGYTHEEIGQMLGIQAGTSKAQLFRARGRLRESLAAFAGAWTA
ncbi:MAG TPA: sigma-70 family RNA polymerase sigma factor, partial [Gemmatimonadaceae bacterium]|nr:sigma-70 family RNA polymerase sigma factor [Gemmatimonadaceae bacterium]